MVGINQIFIYFFPSSPDALVKVNFVPIKICVVFFFWGGITILISIGCILLQSNSFLFCVSSVVWVHLFIFQLVGCMYSLNA